MLLWNKGNERFVSNKSEEIILSSNQDMSDLAGMVFSIGEENYLFTQIDSATYNLIGLTSNYSNRYTKPILRKDIDTLAQWLNMVKARPIGRFEDVYNRVASTEGDE